MFPYIGEVICRRHPMGPAVHSLLVTRAICSRGVLYMGCVGPSLVMGLTTVGTLVGGSCPHTGWMPGPA